MLDGAGSFKHLAEHMEALLSSASRVGRPRRGCALGAALDRRGVNRLLKRMTPGGKQRASTSPRAARDAIFRARPSPDARDVRARKLAEWYDPGLLSRARALYADDYEMLRRLGVDL